MAPVASILTINSSVEFLTYHPKLFSSPLTQSPIRFKPLPPSFLLKYRRSTSLLVCSVPSQSAFTCSMLTKETLEQGVKYVQS